MKYSLLADLVVVLHFCFVIFVVLGGLLVYRYPKMLFIHLLAVAWGVYVEFTGKICPLTYVEYYLREMGGERSARSTFVDAYLVPVLYPEGLTPQQQVVLGFIVLGVNAIIYGWLLVGKFKKKAP